MARSWHYPRWRRVALQGALVIVLCVTLGVAAWVDQYKGMRVATELGQVVRLGDLRVRIPLNWGITGQVQQRDSSAVRAQASDGSRRISIANDRVTAATSPEEYLYLIGVLGADESKE